MKKQILFLAVAVAVAFTGCRVDADVGRLRVIDDIVVRPEGDPKGDAWSRAQDKEGIYYFAEKPMPEMTPAVFERGGYTTYFKYIYDDVPTQEPLPVTVRQVVKDIDGDFQFTYNIYCEYAVGKVTLMMRASDGGTIPITDDMFFRLVITY